MAVVTKTNWKKISNISSQLQKLQSCMTINSTFKDFMKRNMINYYAYFTCFDKKNYSFLQYFISILNGIKQQVHPIFTSLHIKVKWTQWRYATHLRIERLQMKKEIPYSDTGLEKKSKNFFCTYFFHEYLEKVFCCCNKRMH